MHCDYICKVQNMNLSSLYLHLLVIVSVTITDPLSVMTYRLLVAESMLTLHMYTPASVTATDGKYVQYISEMISDVDDVSALLH